MKKRPIIIQGYKVFRRGNKIVAHEACCKDKDCSLDAIRLPLMQAAKLLDGKLKVASGMLGYDNYSVEYPDKNTVIIGCTMIPMKEVRKIRKFLYE